MLVAKLVAPIALVAKLLERGSIYANTFSVAPLMQVAKLLQLGNTGIDG